MADYGDKTRKSCAVSAAISILALLRWPLTPQVMEECAAELEQRNSGRDPAEHD